MKEMVEQDIDVYMLCSVRNATEKEKAFLKSYKKKLEDKGLKVHYPATDTVQKDPTGGYQICKDHCDEITRSKTVHVCWNPESIGSYVDLGTALNEHHRRGLDVILANRKEVGAIVDKQMAEGTLKSYEQVLLTLDNLADPATRV